MSRMKRNNGVEVEESVGDEKPQEIPVANVSADTKLPVEPARPRLAACPRDGATRFQVVHFGQVVMDGSLLNEETAYVCVSCHGVWKLGELAEHRWKL